MLTIKVLGSGCENCHKVEATARQVVSNMGMQAEFVKVTDWEEIKKYPILATPGLVINEKLVCAGRVPPANEVMTLIANVLAEKEAN